MSLLTIVQSAARRIGIPSPSSVVSNSDQSIAQLLALLNQEGLHLMRRYEWSRLVTEGTFTTVATEDQVTLASSFPAFDRFVNGTMYNRTRMLRLYGPLSSEEWQRVKAVQVATTESHFRIRGGKIIFTPTPTAGDTVAFEYVSKNWCQSSGGTGQSAFAADTDAGVLDEELLTLGAVVRFKQAKGLEYGEDFRQYEMTLAGLAGQDAAKPVVYMGRTRRGPPEFNIPEGSWPTT